MPLKKPTVFIVCPGLGRINRGYESFAHECFDVLKDCRAFRLYLLKGGGKQNEREVTLFNLHRNAKVTKWLAMLFKKQPYYLEQVSFLLALLPLIVIKRPALIYYSDYMLGSYLWHLRKRLKFSYKLLFANGAPNGPPYKTEDHVQQLLPVYHSIGIKCDGDSKHTCLPYGFNIDIAKRIKNIQQKGIIRKQWGFNPGQKIVLSVGAVNMQHKRMDYLINEIALLDKSWFLIIIGQYDDETPAVMKLAEKKLPGRHFIKNVKHGEVFSYYIAADYFVLASLIEGFGRATIEALSYGLPCIVHDYIVQRQLLKEYGFYIDMRFEGMLMQCLSEPRPIMHYKTKAIKFVHDGYSWESLKARYEQMIISLLK
jgi:glycosyltransferase involved in cell wall biosynthesis